MPNWCATNWVVRAKRDTVNELKDIFNSLKEKNEVDINAFGKQWLGNLFVALGYDYLTIDTATDNCRGHIDSNCMARPAWSLGDPSEDPFESVDIDGGLATMAFSTQTAWSFPVWLYKEFTRRGLEVAYVITEETNDFNLYRNAELLREYPDLLELHELGGDSCEYTKWFHLGQEKEMLEEVEKVTGIHFDAEEAKENEFKNVQKALDNWQRQMPDDREIYLIAYVEDKRQF